MSATHAPLYKKTYTCSSCHKEGFFLHYQSVNKADAFAIKAGWQRVGEGENWHCPICAKRGRIDPFGRLSHLNDEDFENYFKKNVESYIQL